MYCGCLMMFVSFISHVIPHCNVFSPWVLNSSLWTLTADGLGIAVLLPLLPGWQTFTKLDALANSLRPMFSEGRHHQNWECVSLSITAAVPNSIMNVQHICILEDPKAGMS